MRMRFIGAVLRLMTRLLTYIAADLIHLAGSFSGCEGRQKRAVVAYQLLHIHSRTYLVRINILGDHRLHLGILSFKGFECTVHNKMLDGKFGGINFAGTGEEIQFPFSGITMVSETLHCSHSVDAS